jgi:hypothetical protein
MSVEQNQYGISSSRTIFNKTSDLSYEIVSAAFNEGACLPYFVEAMRVIEFDDSAKDRATIIMDDYLKR